MRTSHRGSRHYRVRSVRGDSSRTDLASWSRDFRFLMFRKVLAVVLAVCLTVNGLPTPSSKVDRSLQLSLQEKNLVNIFVAMREGNSGVLDEVNQSIFSDRGERATAVYKALTLHAKETQRNVLEVLAAPRFFTVRRVESFWVTNKIYVKGADASLIDYLASLDDVSAITEEEIIYLDDQVERVDDSREPGVLAEWGIEKIQAQQAWAVAGNGSGAVIGVIDSGARDTHEAIRTNYRGGQHSWYDPINNLQFPYDGHGHGTHCTGTAAGSHGIGVAPGAKWISCKGLSDSGSGASSGLIKCFQFMACPHNWNGQNPDCSQAPHVVSNSWGGAGGRDIYDDSIRAWHAAGVIPVFGLGNNGGTCRTAGYPGDSKVGVIGVGATTDADAITSFSSRGPSVWEHQKPEVSAPGSQIRSAGISSDTAYTVMSGTSMACPHVAGLVGLLKSRSPSASYTTIANVLQNSADRNLASTGETCDGVTDRQFPNFKFGHGRINALSAVQAIMAL